MINPRLRKKVFKGMVECINKPFFVGRKGGITAQLCRFLYEDQAICFQAVFDFSGAREVSCDNRAAAGQGLQDHKGKAFVEGREDENV